MPIFAPETPTTEELQELYPLNDKVRHHIQAYRRELGRIICGSQEGLIAIIGPCAMTNDEITIDNEGHQLVQLEDEEEDLVALHRLPFWKPRTNPERDWNGRETTEPEGTYATLRRRASAGDSIEVEIGHAPHITRYGELTTMGRVGSRNIKNQGLIKAIAKQDPSLPIGVKNGLDGELSTALGQVKRIEDLRGRDSAPAILIYRGGENAKNPKAWKEQYKQAYELTNGRFIVDIAHGTEIAHNIYGETKKSAAGQVAALGHVIQLAEEGYIPRGIMAEASDANSPTDPHMSFDLALGGIRRMNNIRRDMLAKAA